MTTQANEKKGDDEETYHHDDTRLVRTENAVRRVRKVITDDNDYETMQRPELGGSD